MGLKFIPEKGKLLFWDCLIHISNIVGKGMRKQLNANSWKILCATFFFTNRKPQIKFIGHFVCQADSTNNAANEEF